MDGDHRTVARYRPEARERFALEFWSKALSMGKRFALVFQAGEVEPHLQPRASPSMGAVPSLERSTFLLRAVSKKATQIFEERADTGKKKAD